MIAVFLVVLGLWLTPLTGMQGPTATAADQEADAVVIEVFWGEGCRFCEELFGHLDALDSELDGRIEVIEHEVWSDAANRELLRRRAEGLGVSVGGVPFTVIGDRSWVGFGPSVRSQIDTAIRSELGLDIGASPLDTTKSDSVVTVPFVGEVDVQGRSLFVATVLIAFVDGFNPCSLWVLTVLLALVLHTGSRRRVALIGGTFLIVTTIVYGLFIIGVYSALSFVGALGWIRLAVAAFAIAFGLVNIKDFLWFKVGPSLTIPDERKPAIYRRARGLVRPGIALPAAMAGAAMMAAGIALVEIPCTAGFPVIWSDLVRAADPSRWLFGSLLGVYLTVYLLDELVVFGAAVVTMRATKLQERHGRFLKLVGGMVMITIGITILSAPELLERPIGVLVVFTTALVASAVVWALTRLRRTPTDQPTAARPSPEEGANEVDASSRQ